MGEYANYTIVEPLSKKQKKEAYLTRQQAKNSVGNFEIQNENHFIVIKEREPIKNNNIADPNENFNVSSVFGEKHEAINNQPEYSIQHTPTIPQPTNDIQQLIDQSDSQNQEIYLTNQLSEIAPPTSQILENLFDLSANIENPVINNRFLSQEPPLQKPHSSPSQFTEP